MTAPMIAELLAPSVVAAPFRRGLLTLLRRALQSYASGRPRRFRVRCPCFTIGRPYYVGNKRQMMIRSATEEDALVLGKVHTDAWRAAYRGLVPESYLQGLDCERRAARFRESLAAKTADVHLLECEREVLGFCTLSACRDDDIDSKQTGEICAIYLAPEHWRKGMGTLLCRYAEKTLRERGYAEVVLWVFEANEQARRFYEAMGFRTDGAAKTLNPGAPLEAIRYRKDLRMPNNGVHGRLASAPP